VYVLQHAIYRKNHEIQKPLKNQGTWTFCIWFLDQTCQSIWVEVDWSYTCCMSKHCFINFILKLSHLEVSKQILRRSISCEIIHNTYTYWSFKIQYTSAIFLLFGLMQVKFYQSLTADYFR
jgi:hypothetical protein